jgi:hypothetical protein
MANTKTRGPATSDKAKDLEIAIADLEQALETRTAAPLSPVPPKDPVERLKQLRARLT